MPRLAPLARITSITAFGGLLLAACAQGETLDGFGGSDFTSGSGGTAGTTTGKATGSTANASTNAVVSSSATSTKSVSASNSVSATTNTTNTTATTAAPAASTTAVTTGGTMACFDVCTAGPAPDPLACFGDPNALACITGICIADPDCCDVAWDDACALAGTFAAVTGACSC